MKPVRIILVRHGESQGNIDKSIYNEMPDWAIPLTDKGKEQAQNMKMYGTRITERLSYLKDRARPNPKTLILQDMKDMGKSLCLNLNGGIERDR